MQMEGDDDDIRLYGVEQSMPEACLMGSSISHVPSMILVRTPATTAKTDDNTDFPFVDQLGSHL